MPDRCDAKLLQVLAVRLGRTVSSISFSRKAASYFPRPKLRSQTTMSMMGAPINRGHIMVCPGERVQRAPAHASPQPKRAPDSRELNCIKR